MTSIVSTQAAHAPQLTRCSSAATLRPRFQVALASEQFKVLPPSIIGAGVWLRVPFPVGFGAVRIRGGLALYGVDGVPTL